MLDLGSQPLANRLLNDPDDLDPVYPLHLKICARCFLGQVGEYVAPQDIFGDYPYLSSMSSSWLAHVEQYAAHMAKELHLMPGELVVEVASNDGHLLKGFKARGMEVLGVEPATNVAAIARSSGIPTECAFFGRAAAARIGQERPAPRLVTANNVLAHVPDLDDFVSGLAVLADEQTVITVENPSFTELLEGRQFDTIYHEHFSYLSATSLAALAARHGLELVRIEQLPTHGGSLRYWLMRRGVTTPAESLDRTLADDRVRGLDDPSMWRAFAEDSHRILDDLRTWFQERRATGHVVVGYGAAAKGNTLLNAVGASAADLVAVADASPEKVGKFLPGTHVPVVTPGDLILYQPTDVLLLPWNIKKELVERVQELLPSVRTWIGVPHLSEVSS